MSVYADYSEDDRLLLRRSLGAAAVFVSASSPGRKEETVSEGYAAAELVLRSQADYVGNTLVTSIIVDIEQRVEDDSLVRTHRVVVSPFLVGQTYLR